MIEKYLGFYLSKPCWIEQAIDIENGIPQDFSKQMEEERFSYEGSGFILKIFRDGQFLIRIKKDFGENPDPNVIPNLEAMNKKWSAHLNFANALILLFESAFLTEFRYGYFEIQELTKSNTFVVNCENGRMSGNTMAEGTVKEYQSARLRWFLPPMNPQGFEKYHPFFHPREVIKKSVLDKLSADLNMISNDERLIRLLSQFTKSISEFKIRNFDTSLVLSWFVIESIINDKYHPYQTEKEKKENSHPTGVKRKIEILKENEIMSDEFALELQEIREVRNKIAHSGYVCSLNDAEISINLLTNLLENHFSLKVIVNLSLFRMCL